MLSKRVYKDKNIDNNIFNSYNLSKSIINDENYDSIKMSKTKTIKAHLTKTKHRQFTFLPVPMVSVKKEFAKINYNDENNSLMSNTSTKIVSCRRDKNVITFEYLMSQVEKQKKHKAEY